MHSRCGSPHEGFRIRVGSALRRIAGVTLFIGSCTALIGCGTAPATPPSQLDARISDSSLDAASDTAAPADATPTDGGAESDASATDAGLLDAGTDDASVTYTEARASCTDRNPYRNAYFGDLHVHTSYSYDAYTFGVRNDPAAAYRFAKGEAIPLAEGGMAQLSRPLDFAAVTDHSEFLGEVELCTVAGTFAYNTTFCRTYRSGIVGFAVMGADLLEESPTRSPGACGRDGSRCPPAARTVWQRIQSAAEEAYDRSSECSFTTFVAYEWSASANRSMRHRNVIFRNANVPELPISYYEALHPLDLWNALGTTCLHAGTGCDVLAIPHNPNWSSGHQFDVEAGSDMDEQRARATLESAMEPLLEVIQHKGASECNGIFSNDESCAFEIIPRDACGGTGEEAGEGDCYAKIDFLRGILLEGMKEETTLGVNRLKLGVIGSTDTHNGTPGNTEEATFQGHVGSQDESATLRLTDAIVSGPGGLAGVWAVENSRDAIFEALRRRETFATSGTRIRVRLFGGWSYEDDLCNDPQELETAYQDGVPMGSDLSSRPTTHSAPKFLVSAMQDETPLAAVQIVKGWLDTLGVSHEQVFTVAGDASAPSASVDLNTCETTGDGLSMPCSVWTDPDFDPSVPAFYYARVLENPTCRWSTRDCNSISEPRPANCDNPDVPKTIQERAWSSPIWYTP